MNTLTLPELEALALLPPPPPADYIRVQLDTGGIAAGAEATYEAFRTALAAAQLPIALRRVGSHGRSWADPVVEVCAGGLPPIL
ncbi:MAG TPA: hypothetical protein VK163_13995, partial [Opitutaceae bacterium]|nr:hypothetical protein [Opitutaceae bacterium]